MPFISVWTLLCHGYERTGIDAPSPRASGDARVYGPLKTRIPHRLKHLQILEMAHLMPRDAMAALVITMGLVTFKTELPAVAEIA